jgi:hypothetical protein
MRCTLRKRVAAAVAGVAALAGAPAAFVIGTAAPVEGQTVVSTEAELRTAFANDSSIQLANDITLVDCSVSGGDVDRDGPNAAVTFDGRGHTITQTCASERVLEVNDSSPLTLPNVTITGGRESSDGGGLEADDGDVNVVNSTFAGNCAGDDGGAIQTEEGADVTLIASTLADNLAEGEAGAIRTTSDNGPGDILTVNSTVTNNTAGDDGALDNDAGGGTTTVYSTIVQNILDPDAICDTGDAVTGTNTEDAEPADVASSDDDVSAAQPIEDAANIDAEEFYRSFGSVVALPIGGLNCENESSTTSSGFNFSDDDTCGFTEAAQGDRESAGDPGLAALASNGGPTQTRLPEPGSPLLNFIPIPDCSGGDDLAGFAVTTDQRGVQRPQETGCEIGSVEIEAPPEPVPPAVVPTAVPVEPRFTG